MSIKCLHCGALHFDIEKLSLSIRNEPKFGICCLQGQVRLAKLKCPLTELWNLFSGSNSLSVNFKKNIQQYNAAFAFTSLGAKIDYSVLTANGHGPYTFWINGELYYRSGSLISDDENPPTYAQIYINDEAAQRDAQMNRNPNLSPELIAKLQAMMLHLRLLLIAVPGATSFQFLHTFNREQVDSFRTACVQHGLLEDDNEWRQCLEEAGQMQTGSALRSLFAIILLNCYPSMPDELWEWFKHQICDDLRCALQRLQQFENLIFTDDNVNDYGVYLLNKLLLKSGKTLKDFPPMPLFQQPWELQISDNQILNEQLNYDHAALQELIDQNYQSFNNE